MNTKRLNVLIIFIILALQPQIFALDNQFHWQSQELKIDFFQLDLMNTSLTYFLTDPINCQKVFTLCPNAEESLDKQIDRLLTNVHRSKFAPTIIYIPSGKYTVHGNLFSNLMLIGAGPEETILEGNLSRPIISLDNVENVTLKDITFQHGKNFLTEMRYGGAVRARNSRNIKIENCHFTRNFAYLGGGAVGFERCQNISILECWIGLPGNLCGNAAYFDGGGIYIDSSNEVTIEQNIFWGNVALFAGGGMYVINSEHINFRLNLWGASDSEERNRAKLGGGLAIVDSSEFNITENLFLSNFASLIGGGLFVSDSEKCHVQSNAFGCDLVTPSNESHYIGGGCAILRSMLDSLKDNSFSFNKTRLTGGGMLLIDTVKTNDDIVYSNFFNNPDNSFCKNYSRQGADDFHLYSRLLNLLNLASGTRAPIPDYNPFDRLDLEIQQGNHPQNKIETTSLANQADMLLRKIRHHQDVSDILKNLNLSKNTNTSNPFCHHNDLPFQIESQDKKSNYKANNLLILRNGGISQRLSLTDGDFKTDENSSSLISHSRFRSDCDYRNKSIIEIKWNPIEPWEWKFYKND